MQNFLSLGYMLHVLLAVSANFPDNPRTCIYPTELQLKKQIRRTKKLLSFIYNVVIKVIGSNVHTSVCDKRDDFGFPIVNFPWLSGVVPRFPSYQTVQRLMLSKGAKRTIFYHITVIKVCRQRRKTFLLLYCLFFLFLFFLSHYLRSAISLSFFIGSLSYLVSW